MCTAAQLAGIVSNNGPLIAAPSLCSAVKGAGLRLLTYGRRNNEIDIVRRQLHDWMVDAVIADHVAHLRRLL